MKYQVHVIVDIPPKNNLFRLGLIITLVILTALRGYTLNVNSTSPQNPFTRANELANQHKYIDAVEAYKEVLLQHSISNEQQIFGQCQLIRNYRRSYQYDSAWSLVQRTEMLVRKTLPDIDTLRAIFYHEKGELCEYINKYAESEESLKEAIKIRTEIFGPNGCITAASILELGELYNYRLKLQKLAEPLFLRSFLILNDCYDKPNYLTSVAAHGLAHIYYEKGEFDYAFEMEKRALIESEGLEYPNYIFLAFINRFLASLASSTGNIADAVKYANTSLELLKRHDPTNKDRIYYSSLTLGYNLYQNGELEAAISEMESSLTDISRQPNPGEFHIMKAYLHYQLAEIQSTLGNRKAFDSLLNSCYYIMQQNFGPCSHNAVMQQNEIANMYRSLGDLTTAIAINDSAVNCLTSKDTLDQFDFYLLGQLYEFNGKLYNETGQLEDAIKHYELADSVFKLHKLNTDWATSKLNTAKYNKQFYDDAIQVCSELSKQNEKWLDAVFDFMESNKSFMLFESLHNSILLNSEIGEAWVRDSLNTLERTISILETSNIEKQEYVGELENLKYLKSEIYDYLEGDLLVKNQTSFYSSLVKLNEVQNQLNPDCAILYYHHVEDTTLGYFRLYITRDSASLTTIREPVSLDSFLRQFHDFKTVQFSFSQVNDYERTAFELYNAFIPKENEKIKRWIIVPDGKLNFLPFEALVSSYTNSRSYEDLDYLIRHQSVQFCYSMSHLMNSHRNLDHHKYAIGVFPYSEIDYGAIEKNAIQQTFPRSNIISGNSDKFQVIRSLKDADIIHFATHGILDSINTHANYLALGDSTKIYAYELGSLNLEADLVFLNACETARGAVFEGEGIFNMARALLQSGCPTTIATSWKIPDHSSAKITKAFYRQIKGKTDLVESLNTAKLSYLDNLKIDPLEKHPYFWAGIHIVGLEDRLNIPIKANKYILTFSILGGLLLVFWIALFIQKAR